MKRAKKRVLILVTVCVVILIGAVIADIILGKSYLKQIKYDQMVEKIDNKESFVIVFSQTNCEHCLAYKPKLAKVAKKYKLVVYYLETDLLSEKKEKELKKYFNFDGTPTTVFVIKGEEKTAANRIVGEASEEKIIKKLKSNGFIK